VAAICRAAEVEGSRGQLTEGVGCPRPLRRGDRAAYAADVTRRPASIFETFDNFTTGLTFADAIHDHSATPGTAEPSPIARPGQQARPHGRVINDLTSHNMPWTPAMETGREMVISYAMPLGAGVIVYMVSLGGVTITVARIPGFDLRQPSAASLFQGFY
jgi:hypothetical protein